MLVMRHPFKRIRYGQIVHCFFTLCRSSLFLNPTTKYTNKLEYDKITKRNGRKVVFLLSRKLPRDVGFWTNGLISRTKTYGREVHGPLANETTFIAQSAMVHPMYEPGQENDVSIVIAESSLPLVPVNVGWNMPFTGVDCHGIGFGIRYPSPFQRSISQCNLARLPIHQYTLIPKEVCAVMKNISNHKVICSLLLGGRGPCVGDSGGPMICEGNLFGLLSRGLLLGDENCGLAHGVLMYENIFYYKEWIQQTIESIASRKSSRNKSSRITNSLISLVIFCAIQSTSLYILKLFSCY